MNIILYNTVLLLNKVHNVPNVKFSSCVVFSFFLMIIRIWQKMQTILKDPKYIIHFLYAFFVCLFQEIFT